MELNKATVEKNSFSPPDWSSTEFISTTVHEINNYLSAVTGFAELTKMDVSEGSDLEKYLSEIILAVERQAEFNQFLSMLSGNVKPLIEIVNGIELSNVLGRYGLDCEVRSDINITANKAWLDKLTKAIQDFVASLPEANSVVSFYNFDSHVEFKIKIQHAELNIDFINFFQPYYTSRALLNEKGLGLCWLPELMEKIRGRVDVSQINSKQFLLKLSFLKDTFN